MTEATGEELAAAYRRLRARTVAMGRQLDDPRAAAMSPCCPDWSVKDLFAHMTGVPSDILDGNTAEAATEAWADAQVERRGDHTLNDILDEWNEKGPQLDDLLTAVGPEIAFQFYLDAWTHEWDIRQAIGAEPVEPDYSLVAHAVLPLLDNLGRRLAERALAPADLVLHGLADGPLRATFDGGPPDRAPVTIELSLFEYLRIAMGRRSRRQIEAALGTERLPAGAWADGFVVWSINDVDIVDPVSATAAPPSSSPRSAK